MSTGFVSMWFLRVKGSGTEILDSIRYLGRSLRFSLELLLGATTPSTSSGTTNIRTLEWQRFSLVARRV